MIELFSHAKIDEIASANAPIAVQYNPFYSE